MLILFILTTISLLANAQHGRPWHGGNIHRFEMHDRHIWSGGHWSHSRYRGRVGWWWVVGPSWYYYPRPYYPYPDPYTPPVVILESTPAPSTPGTPPPVQNWYYCEAAKEYYPYVDNCPGGWKAVPVTPPK